MKTKEQQKAALDKLRADGLKKFGHKSASLGSDKAEIEVVPTPSLMLDYKTGRGGFPYGLAVECFGDNTLGKTSAVAYGVAANVQKMGRLCAYIAAEPLFDESWATQFGVDPEMLLIKRPQHAEEAWEMMHDLVYSDLVDYIIFDSVGALGTESETEKGTKKAYGASGVITSGLNAIMPRCYRNNTGVLLLNQQRVNTAGGGSRITYESPGGEGLKHHAVIRLQLKPGKGYYTVKRDGEDVLVGRTLICTFLKNKLAYNMKGANFDFFYQATPEYGPVGVDLAEDVINTGKVTGVLKASGSWLEHPSFGKVQGKPALKKKIEDDPSIVDAVRKDVIVKMQEKQEKLAEENEKAKLRLVDHE